MSAPYYADDAVTLYFGDCREILPSLTERPVACVTDPPYGETSATWDRWQTGWVAAVGEALPASASLWCFGTARMFLDHAADFAGWRYAQEALWLKRNGTGPGKRDRLTKVHEWAYHWYRGRWTDLRHEWEREPAWTDDKSARRQAHAAAHRSPDRADVYVDDGYRQPRSVTWVIEAPSVRYRRRHPDEKPAAVVEQLITECVPPGGLVLDSFPGSGSTLVAARDLGRRAVGVEIDERCCEVIARRLQQGSLTGGAA